MAGNIRMNVERLFCFSLILPLPENASHARSFSSEQEITRFRILEGRL